MFQKDSGTAGDWWPNDIWPTSVPCDHSHDPCQHCYHNCGECRMSYCCKCGRTWGSWTVTYTDSVVPEYTTTNPHVDDTWCGHSH